MSIIIRLQNLPWSANSLDIRRFFDGLGIPEGGVHIVGGEKGDAFIAFLTDEDARQAMQRDGGKIKEIRIKLLLSSRAEMQKVIELARSGFLLSTMQAPKPSSKENERKRYSPERDRGRSRERDREKNGSSSSKKFSRRNRDSRSRSRSRSRSPRRYSNRDRERDKERSKDKDDKDRKDKDKESRKSEKSSRKEERRRSEEKVKEEKDDKDENSHSSIENGDTLNIPLPPAPPAPPATTSDNSKSTTVTNPVVVTSSVGNSGPRNSPATQTVVPTTDSGMTVIGTTTSSVTTGVTSVTGSIYSMVTGISNMAGGMTGAANVMSSVDSSNMPLMSSGMTGLGGVVPYGSLFPIVKATDMMQSAVHGMDRMMDPSFSTMGSINRFGIDANRMAMDPVGLGIEANRLVMDQNRLGLEANRLGLEANRLGLDANVNRLSLDQTMSIMGYDSAPRAPDNASTSRPVDKRNPPVWQENAPLGLLIGPAAAGFNNPNYRDLVLGANSRTAVEDFDNYGKEGYNRNRFDDRDDDSSSSRGPSRFNEGNDPDPRRSRVERAPEGFFVELSNMPPNSGYKDIRDFLRGLVIVPDGISILTDEYGHRTGRAVIKFANERDTKAAMRKHGTQMGNKRADVNRISERQYDEKAASVSQKSPVSRNPPHRLPAKKEDMVVVMKNIPFTCRESEIINFFDGVNILDMLIEFEFGTSKPTGSAFVEFGTAKDMQSALKRDGNQMGSRFVHITVGSKEMMAMARKNNMGDKAPPNRPPEEDESRHTCVILRNLPPAVTSVMITKFFSEFNIVPKAIHIMLSPNGGSNGDAFIELASPADVAVSLRKQGSFIGQLAVKIHSLSLERMTNILGLPQNPSIQKVEPPRDKNRPERKVLMGSPPRNRDNSEASMDDGSNSGPMRRMDDGSNSGPVRRMDDGNNSGPMRRMDDGSNSGPMRRMDEGSNSGPMRRMDDGINSGPMRRSDEMDDRDMGRMGGRPPMNPNSRGMMMDGDGPPGPMMGMHPMDQDFEHQDEYCHPDDFNQHWDMGPGPMRGGPPMGGQPFFGPQRFGPPHMNPNGPFPQQHMGPRMGGPMMGPPEMFGNNGPGCVLGVANLPFRATIDEIIQFFKGHNLAPDDIMRRYDQYGRATGDARIAFRSPEEAQGAFKEFNGKHLHNRAVNVFIL